MTSALIAVLMVASAQAQTAPAPIDATYRFTVGGAPVVDATLWLYNEETLWPGSRRAWHRPKRRQHDSPDASMIESIDSHGDANVYWVALHVEDDNHHLVSDNDGYVQFLAPFTRMVLHVEHYARQRNAAGRDVLVVAEDLDLPPALNQTIRLQMRAPERSFTVRVLTPDDAPVAGVWLVKNEEVCGAGDGPAGTTDANGDVNATFAPEHAASLWLQTESSDGYYAAAGDQRRMLSEAELAQLFRTGVLTVKWRPPK